MLFKCGILFYARLSHGYLCCVLQVEFTVDWIKGDICLKDFEMFLKKVFGFIHKYIKLTAVRQSLLVLICSTPFFMVAAIIRIVQEREQLLLKSGVVSIVVGSDVVFKVRQTTQI